MSILVVGSIAYDTIETPHARVAKVLGGSASYFALAARSYAPIRVVGVVGADFRRDDLELLGQDQVDIGGVQRAGGSTFHWSGRYHEDLIERDTLVTDLGVFADFRPDIPTGWEQTPYVFLANIQPELQLRVLNSITQPRLIVLDTMNLWIQTARDALQEVLARVHVLLVNDSEARLFTGQRSLQKAARTIQEMGPTWVVVKKGEHGALFFGRDSVLAVPAILLPEVIDPTGAGDSFAGGFLGYLASVDISHMAEDGLFRQAMLHGTATASFCPEGFSVEGLLRIGAESIRDRVSLLRDMMIP